MTQIEKDFYKVIEKAKQAEKEGFCSVFDCEDSNNERRFSIDWNLQTGEDFVKASALVHIIGQWSEYQDGEEGYVEHGVTDDTDKMFIIDVSCVWL